MVTFSKKPPCLLRTSCFPGATSPNNTVYNCPLSPPGSPGRPSQSSALGLVLRINKGPVPCQAPKATVIAASPHSVMATGHTDPVLLPEAPAQSVLSTGPDGHSPPFPRGCSSGSDLTTLPRGPPDPGSFSTPFPVALTLKTQQHVCLSTMPTAAAQSRSSRSTGRGQEGAGALGRRPGLWRRLQGDVM